MRGRPAFVGALFALLIVLAGLSAPRMLGDSGDYVVMALNLAHGTAPSLSAEDLRRAMERFPGDVGARLAIPELRSDDGRQDLPHFWFYPLLASPFVRMAEAIGADPIRGFAAINLLLLAVAAIVLSARQSYAVTMLVIAGPILWWTDKAQTEVFTFSLLTIAIAMLREAPWWSAVAFGAASTQNPPLAVAMLLSVAYAAFSAGWRDRRVWIAAAAGCALAALHPLYYHARLGIWSTLQLGVDPHWPDLREILTPILDPNLGIFVYDFPLTLALIAAIVLLASDPRRSPKRILDDGRGIIVAIAALLLVSFTQTTNVNSGGTPGPSRYGLWLIPLTLPLLATTVDGRWLRAIAALSLVWCGVRFAPRRAEQYVAPSALAATIWERWPGLDNPVAEVFAERAGGREPALPLPIVASACRKALLEGDGRTQVSLAQCYANPTLDVPSECRGPGVYCYANRNGAAWQFVRASSTPYWRTIMERQKGAAEQPTVTLESGWSFEEHSEAQRMQPATSWRWMGDAATVQVAPPARKVARIRIVARAFGKPRRLRLNYRGTVAAEFALDESPRFYETAPLTLPAGVSEFELMNLDGTDAGPPGDNRRLGIALFRFEIVIADPRAAPR